MRKLFFDRLINISKLDDFYSQLIRLICSIVYTINLKKKKNTKQLLYSCFSKIQKISTDSNLNPTQKQRWGKSIIVGHKVR